MNKIIFPLQPGMQGAAVADLQDALQLFMDRGIILANDPIQRVALSVKLRIERTAQVYHDTTQKLLSIFQQTRHIQPNGEVDEPTAKELNRVLKELGVLDEPAEPAPPAPPRSFIVSGRVRREDGLPLRSMSVGAVHESEAGPVRLGEDTTSADGRYTIRYEQLPGVDAINLRVSVSDNDGQLLKSSEVF
ncbi:MAG TPA: hypothetical protein VMS31_14870, partial [Pyrinomonadaceae bacterium]|nr:hypothetical protein [Pyrinomonadaceae bacterium]